MGIKQIEIGHGKILALDGLRGVAILLVVISHTSEHFRFTDTFLKGGQHILFIGWTGVDLFFVLSGFLITGILYDSKLHTHYFRNFFLRRALRIFPLYYFVLLSMFYFIPLLTSSLHIHQFPIISSPYSLWFFTYFLDVLIALKGWVFPGHFWSLAVEEHFYMIWPFIVYYLNKTQLIRVSIILIIITLSLRIYLAFTINNPIAIYVLTPCRLDGLLIGAILSILFKSVELRPALKKISIISIAFSGLIWGTIIFFYNGYPQYPFIIQTFGYFNTAVFYGSLLIIILTIEKANFLISGSSLRFFGKYSYAIYVFHIFPIFFFKKFFALGDPYSFSILSKLFYNNNLLTKHSFLFLVSDSILFLLATFLSTLIIVLISWNFLESPFLKLKRFFPN